MESLKLQAKLCVFLKATPNFQETVKEMCISNSFETCWIVPYMLYIWMCLNEGFRTAAISQPFLLLEDLKHGKYEMVEVKSKCSNRVLETLQGWGKYISKF